MDHPRVFIIDVTYEKRFRVTIGGDGSARIAGEQDDAAAEAIVHDYAHLDGPALPPYITLEGADMNIESVIEQIDAKV